MKFIQFALIIFGSVSLFSLAACGTKKQAANPENSPAPTPEQTVIKTESASEEEHPSQGGQVVESGPYHLEFLSFKEEGGTHLDFYFQTGDTHEAIPNANVTAQIQLPDGTQKKLPLTYDAEGKHYAALLPETAPGQYQIKITSEINGEKVDGRFSFNR